MTETNGLVGMLDLRENQGGFQGITSVQKAQLVINDPEFRNRLGIHLFFTLTGRTPIYDSRKTHYGQEGPLSGGKELNIYEKGVKLFKVCPAFYFSDGGIEFLDGFGGQATEKPSMRIKLVPPNGGTPIEYWAHVTNEELKRIIRS